MIGRASWHHGLSPNKTRVYSSYLNFYHGEQLGRKTKWCCTRSLVSISMHPPWLLDRCQCRPLATLWFHDESRRSRCASRSRWIHHGVRCATTALDPDEEHYDDDEEAEEKKREEEERRHAMLEDQALFVGVELSEADICCERSVAETRVLCVERWDENQFSECSEWKQ